MSSTRISVNIDEDVKQNAQQVLREIGMDMTTAIDSFLRTVAREERIPFDLRTERAYREAVAHNEYFKAELEKAKLEAANPNTVWLSHEEVMERIKERQKSRAYV